MRVLLVTVGSHGDIHPFIALADAITRRGHHAAILTNPHFQRVIEQAGIECLPIGDPLDIRDIITSRPVMDAHRGPLTVMRDLMLPVVPQVYERTLASIRDLRADLCIAHPICMGASWACDRAGIPCDIASLAPSIWFNPADQLVMTAWGSARPRPWSVRLQHAAGRFMMRAALDRGLNRVRRELGLPKARDIFFTEALGGRYNLALWSTAFRPPLPGDPPRGRICGFPWHDRISAQDPDWDRVEKFLDDGDPPIVFTLGTAAVHSPGDFYEQAALAGAVTGRRALLLVGRSESVPRDLPPRVAAFAYAPFSRLLPRAAATVHHAGIGTTAQVLRSGRPSVPVPFAHDQFDNAARLERLGVARTVKRGKRLAERLAEALRHVLDDPATRERSAELGDALASEDGAARAADLALGPAPVPTPALAA